MDELLLEVRCGALTKEEYLRYCKFAQTGGYGWIRGLLRFALGLSSLFLLLALLFMAIYPQLWLTGLMCCSVYALFIFTVVGLPRVNWKRQQRMLSRERIYRFYAGRIEIEAVDGLVQGTSNCYDDAIKCVGDTRSAYYFLLMNRTGFILEKRWMTAAQQEELSVLLQGRFATRYKWYK